MATTANTYPGSVRASAPALPALLSQFNAWRARRRERRQVIRELSAHTDRQLADMGITRGDIRAVAAGTFRR